MPIQVPPGVVPREALRYLKAKALRPAFSYLDVWKQEHASAFTVAKVLEQDLLADVQRSLRKALAEGTTFETWAQGIKGTLDKSGWSDHVSERQQPRRLYTIFNTNMRVARAVGQWDRIQRTKVTHPYLEYNLGPSEHHRAEHEAWDGLVLPADHPWWQEHFPPNGWGCKCWVRQVSKAEGLELGLDDAPETEYVDWVNPKTGSTEQVPEGVDPGWDYNPGQAGREAMLESEET